MTYQESIAWLFSTQLFGIKLGLDGPRRLLRKFLAYPPHGTRVIHVAGTNGKGSVCAMADAVARCAGIRTGLFTSPHLVDFRERIQVAGGLIGEEEAAAGLTELRGLCESLDPHPTFFEITLALALRHFQQRNCELLVLETGMGGRLDATTAVPADVCVITALGLDHARWLGDTLERIALEKAGIFVPGVPVVAAPQAPEAAVVLAEQANEVRCPLRLLEEPLRGYPLALAGPHQAWNAALALEALHAAGVHLTYDIVREGLAGVRWPGRFEAFPAPTAGGAPREITLDGAHNPAAAEALAATWREQRRGAPCTLVFSALDDKDVAGILAVLAPLAARIHICPIASQRAMPCPELAALIPAGAPPHAVFDAPAAALAAALAHPEPVLVTGSLFLVGEIRARLTGAVHRPTAQ